MTYYGKTGLMSWSKHYRVHGNSASPHWHLEMPHSGHINGRIQFLSDFLRRVLGGWR